MKREQYRLFDTAFGICGLAWSDEGVTRFRLPGPDGFSAERWQQFAGAARAIPATIDTVIAGIRSHLAGNKTDWRHVSIDISCASAFNRRVYRAIRNIGWGETLSYGDVARRLNTPEAARAVGRALARNPLPLIVPCHRVLAGNGRLGGFSAPGGTTTKARLLALEDVLLADARQADLFPG